MSRPLHILCDLDSIVADLLPVWCDLYNKEFSEHLTIADIDSFGLTTCIPPARLDKMFSFINGETIRNLPLVQGAYDNLLRLSLDGHTIHIVSAYSPEAPDTATEKVKWVRKHLPFINQRFITLMSQKHLIVGDVLIDDRPNTIEAYRQQLYGKDALLCTIAYPYNKCVENLYDCYALDYTKPIDAWGQIYEAIQKKANQ